ncbi:hypothetical protein GOBAR_AA19355 [Gossypium barbadense]|uniref:Uncharacterized protein n=1 Tax=Gossypium barbadense TaxID=3634 RepID=A0A2P5XD75_GOSBA|nr:hypothetical protein GOBAR_AA19355 [Gossypium barbadense]
MIDSCKDSLPSEVDAVSINLGMFYDLVGWFALGAKTRDASIPECEGAATAKSPWNAPGLFDLSVPDSFSMNLVQKREQKTGLKRSYYMDPQTLNRFKWHYYEYEINKCDACALYRLESKLVDGRAKISMKVGVGNPYSTPNVVAPPTEKFDCRLGKQYDYPVNTVSSYHLT